MGLQAVIFDVDGTLAETEEALVLAGAAPNGGDLVSTFGGPNMGLRAARLEVQLAPQVC